MLGILREIVLKTYLLYELRTLSALQYFPESVKCPEGCQQNVKSARKVRKPLEKTLLFSITFISSESLSDLRKEERERKAWNAE